MFNNINIGKRLFALSCIALAFTLIVMITGINGMTKMEGEIEAIGAKNMTAMGALGSMNGTAGKIVADFLLAFQHDPQGPFAALHGDHGVELHLESALMWRGVLEKNWNDFKATPLSKEEEQLVTKFDGHYQDFIGNTVMPTMQKIRGGDYSPELLLGFLKGFMQHGEEMELRSIAAAMDLQKKYSDEAISRSLAHFDSSVTLITVVGILGALLSLGIAYSIIRSITNPLVRLQEGMEEIAKSHDFTLRVPVMSADELGQSAAAFNKLVESVQQSIKRIMDNVEDLDKASATLAESAEQSAKRSDVTSEAASTMAASIEEIAASIHIVSDNAKETSDLTERTEDCSQKGKEVVQRTISEMQVMSEVVLSSSKTIAELGKQSEQISGIVQVIREVADQTNLLALNAAIEAARAGEQGRGFAVVADEVRKLAERTANATGEISAMISAIQTSSQSAVGAMSNAAERVESGVALAHQTGQAIDEIQEGTHQTLRHTKEITTALEEQEVATHGIAKQVELVAQSTEENSIAAHQSSEAAILIDNMAKEIRRAMGEYRV
ncbi:MAG: methyl-accepting chemotaxis protein [Betaproteobacteria bacterium]|nr:methyl-accepting chemotaxis protein [Betaproteobacteria bacterium]